MRTRSDLRDYQEQALDFSKTVPKCALWWEMGLGKTVSTLTALHDLLSTLEIGKTLVIAPKRVARDTWPEEIKAWSHIDLTFSLVAGTPAQRIAALKTQVDVYLLGRDNLPWLVEYLGDKWPFDTVILDESSGFKSPSSVRFKALKKVNKKIKRMIQLTGTPAAEGLLGLWSQIYLLDGGARLGRTFTLFKQRYFVSDYMGYDFTPKPDAQQEIQEKIKDLVLTLTGEVRLPECLYLDTRISLPNEARQQFQKLKKEYLLQLENAEIVAPNAAALINKLLQLGNGAVYEESGAYVHIHDAKLDALEEIIEGVNGAPLLVAYTFKSDLERIKLRFKNVHTIDEKNAVARWNEGKIPILAVHPASVGHGLNLQHGGNRLVWFGLTWSLELYLQMNKRLHRSGQKNTVYIHHLLVGDSIDDLVRAALEKKDTAQASLVQALRRHNI